MQFMKQISDGSVSIKDSAVIVKNDVDMAQKLDESWTDDYLLTNDVSEKLWSDEFHAEAGIEANFGEDADAILDSFLTKVYNCSSVVFECFINWSTCTY